MLSTLPKSGKLNYRSEARIFLCQNNPLVCAVESNRSSDRHRKRVFLLGVDMGFRKHGDHLTRIYALWCNMRYRCRCKTSKDYKNYGAKGITVCKEWEDYIVFKKWAISANYKEGLTIERKNNNKGYNPSNCIFTTIAENNKNRGDTYWWYIEGRKFSSSYDAGMFFGVRDVTIRAWCNGCKTKGKYYQPKNNCYAVKKYGETNANN